MEKKGFNLTVWDELGLVTLSILVLVIGLLALIILLPFRLVWSLFK